MNDNLWALEQNQDRITRVDLTTGLPIAGSSVNLSIDLPNGNSVSDIAFDNNGVMYLAVGDDLYSVDTLTGLATLVADVNDPENNLGIIGLAFSSETGNNAVYALDSFGNDDLGLIALTGANPLSFNILQTVATVAGRGDLAAQIEAAAPAAVPEPASIAAWMSALAALALVVRRRSLMP